MDNHEKPLAVTPLTFSDVRHLMELTFNGVNIDTVSNPTEAMAYADKLSQLQSRLWRTFA